MNNKIYIVLITFLFSIIMTNNIVDKKQKSLKDIEKEIIELEDELQNKFKRKLALTKNLIL